MGELFQEKHSDTDLTVVTVKGMVTADEIVHAVEEYYRETPTRLLLFDFRDADTSSITAEHLRNIAHTSKRLMHSRSGAKSAIVVNSEAAYGMGRMFETFVELEALSIAFNIYKDYQTAMDWILSKDE